MPSEPGLSAGSLIGGVYKIRRMIGQGGMGEVYAAEGRGGEKVALKILHERAAQDPDLVARFNREADIAKKIASPYVAGILGSGKERDGRLWIAFERLVGEGLDERLRREQYLSFADVAPIIEDSLQGLHAAHQAHVVHRDIKPANLFIEKRKLTPEEIRGGDPEERTRILDFGVSKMKQNANRRSEPSLTAFDATLGSFAYMAPEQVRGSARVDERADLYALGAVAFRALTGRLPFEGSNALTLIALKLDRDPPTLASVTGDTWPKAMENYLFKIMSRDREKRFGTAMEALDGWRKVCRQMGNARRTRGGAGHAPPAQVRMPSEPPAYSMRDDHTEVTAGNLDVAPLGPPSRRR
jgi:serine/threonine protein kinase